MIFDSEHKVKIESLNEVEARAFMMFLAVEESRHRIAVERSAQNIKNASSDSEIDQAIVKFEQTAIWRHMQDLEGIKTARAKVKKQFGWIQ